jgi:hypothetical protein
MNTYDFFRKRTFVSKPWFPYPINRASFLAMASNYEYGR